MPTRTISFGQPNSEFDAIEKRRRLAEALQQQSLQPIQSVAPNAPISWTQGLAKMLQAYNSRQDLNKAETDRKALQEQTEQRTGADTALLAQMLSGRQAQPAGLSEDVSGNVTQRDALPAQTPSQSLGQAIPMMGPQMQPVALQALMGAQGRQEQREFQAGEAQLTREAREAQARESRESREQMARETREQRAFDASAQRAQRMQELTMRLSDQRLAAADRAALQRELAMLRADQQRTESELKLVNSPQAIKEREKVQGKESLGGLLDELDSDYKQFEGLGADIDPSRSTSSNVMNRIASSGVGQLVGGAVGTKEQEIRDSINQKRASLMAALKQATGMGATQLNSNVELQFYLRMATDPTMARSANRKAIKWLRDTYGSGGGAAPKEDPSPGVPPGVDPSVWKVMTPEERSLWAK